MIKIEDIEGMGYFDFKASLGECLLHPGGTSSTIEVFSNAPIEVNDPILEIGCGTGFTTIKLLKAGLNLTSCDVNIKMINTTKENARKSGFVFFEPVHASATNLPFKGNSFKLILLEAVFGFIDEKEKAIDEFFRVLETGGYLCYVDMFYISQPDDRLIQQMNEIFKDSIKVITKSDLITLHQGFDLIYWNDYPMKDAIILPVEKIKENLVKTQKNLSNSEALILAEAINKKFWYYELIFRENRVHLRYHISIYRKK